MEKGVRFGDVFLQVIFREMLVKAELGMAEQRTEDNKDGERFQVFLSLLT